VTGNRAMYWYEMLYIETQRTLYLVFSR